MKYVINTNTFETAEQEAQEVIDTMFDSSEFEEMYDSMLDECYGMIDVCGYEYYASVAFKRLDPVAYRCGKNDWLDSVYSDVLYDLEHSNDGTFDFYGVEVEAINEECDDYEEAEQEAEQIA